MVKISDQNFAKYELACALWENSFDLCGFPTDFQLIQTFLPQ